MTEAEPDDMEARFRDLYASTIRTVYGFLAYRVGGDRALAEDMTAETYTAATELYRRGEADVVTVSWLLTVARRRLIDHWRRTEVAQRNVVRLILPDVETDQSREFALREVVVAVLAELSEAERQALVLQHVEGFSVDEVAEIIGRSPKATESLLGRARQKFRTRYEEVDRG